MVFVKWNAYAYTLTGSFNFAIQFAYFCFDSIFEATFPCSILSDIGFEILHKVIRNGHIKV